MQHTILKSLTPDQVSALDTWHQLQKSSLPTLLHCIAKHSLMIQLNPDYHMNEDEALALLGLTDLINHLIATSDK